jgi:hypothetical protein
VTITRTNSLDLLYFRRKALSLSVGSKRAIDYPMKILARLLAFLLAYTVGVALLIWWISVGPAPAQEAMGAIDPSVTAANVQTTICVRGWTKTIRPPVSTTNAIKRELVDEEGGTMADYELDHVIPLDLGGAPLDRRNLALQLWGGACNARQKDALEVKLSRIVCAGELGLDEARAAIAADWRAAFTRHFGHVCGKKAGTDESPAGLHIKP